MKIAIHSLLPQNRSSLLLKFIINNSTIFHGILQNMVSVIMVQLFFFFFFLHIIIHVRKGYVIFIIKKDKEAR